MIVALARLELRLPFSHSLKDKRKVIRSLMGRVKARLDVRMSEVDDQDRWQTATLGFAVVGNSRGVVETVVDAVISYVEGSDSGQLVQVERETVRFDDLSHLAEESA